MAKQMPFVQDDGGRAAAGYKGSTGDCVVRAIAIATQRPYQEVYDAINEHASDERPSKRRRGKSTARGGVHRVTYEPYLKSLGWVYVPTMFIGSGCKVHLSPGELPMGRLVVSVSRHLCAVIDGVIHDTHNPSDRGATIYPAGTPSHLVPKYATKRADGSWVYAPSRCVYGYYVQQEAR
jgi:hypothetical protein